MELRVLFALQSSSILRRPLENILLRLVFPHHRQSLHDSLHNFHTSLVAARCSVRVENQDQIAMSSFARPCRVYRVFFSITICIIFYTFPSRPSSLVGSSSVHPFNLGCDHLLRHLDNHRSHFSDFRAGSTSSAINQSKSFIHCQPGFREIGGPCGFGVLL